MLSTINVGANLTQAGIYLNSVINSEVWFSGFPLSPCEVGDLYGDTALSDRQLGKRSMHGHNYRIIDVDRCLSSIFDGLNKELQLLREAALRSKR